MASRRIEDLHELMQPIAREFLKRADDILGPKQAFITDGYRSRQEQTELYARGRSQAGKIVTYAQAGESPHNYGLAIDIAFRDDGSRGAEWTIANYEKLKDLAVELGLEWGGNWVSFKDRPHYQLKGWKTIINKEKEPMPVTKDPLKECLAQHTVLVTEAGIKDNQIAGHKGAMTKLKNDHKEELFKLNEDLLEAENKLKVKSLSNPKEAIKDPMRYVVSLGVAAAITYLYTQYPVLGELGPDKEGIVTFLISLIVKGLDKYQHEAGSSIKLPF